MRRSRVWAAGGLALLLAFAVGCQLLDPGRQVSVQAVDAETGKPLPDASVRLAWAGTSLPFGKPEALGKTGNDGTAHLAASPSGEDGVMVAVEAPGYLPEETYLTAKSLALLQPASFFGTAKVGKPAVTLPHYAGPRPRVELVVPNGFRGAISAEVVIQDGATLPPGQRCLVAEVSPAGAVEITGPALLRRLDSPDFTAKYADGTPIPRNASSSTKKNGFWRRGELPLEAQIRLWPLSTEERRYSFLVGTRDEYLAARPTTRVGGNTPAGGGRRGGRGGRGLPPA